MHLHPEIVVANEADERIAQAGLSQDVMQEQLTTLRGITFQTVNGRDYTFGDLEKMCPVSAEDRTEAQNIQRISKMIVEHNIAVSPEVQKITHFWTAPVESDRYSNREVQTVEATAASDIKDTKDNKDAVDKTVLSFAAAVNQNAGKEAIVTTSIIDEKMEPLPTKSYSIITDTNETMARYAAESARQRLTHDTETVPDVISDTVMSKGTPDNAPPVKLQIPDKVHAPIEKIAPIQRNRTADIKKPVRSSAHAKAESTIAMPEIMLPEVYAAIEERSAVEQSVLDIPIVADAIEKTVSETSTVPFQSEPDIMNSLELAWPTAEDHGDLRAAIAEIYQTHNKYEAFAPIAHDMYQTQSEEAVIEVQSKAIIALLSVSENEVQNSFIQSEVQRPAAIFLTSLPAETSTRLLEYVGAASDGELEPIHEITTEIDETVMELQVILAEDEFDVEVAHDIEEKLGALYTDLIELVENRQPEPDEVKRFVAILRAKLTVVASHEQDNAALTDVMHERIQSIVGTARDFRHRLTILPDHAQVGKMTVQLATA